MKEDADQAKQLDSVTDNVREAELDASKAQEAMSALGASKNVEMLSKNASDSIAVVSKEDIATIVEELEVSEMVAEQALRDAMNQQSKSPLASALRHLVTS
jgi:hypothetical protein|mmetsp:Transcript_4786/g.8430  ORF Transcript_4786/g.8430 Transcript_4786/m.8430 type:complete len:101 (-) Transcript_4786:252-554(-)|eukprot:scaffold22288_cov50-Attheya_sp.AAC.3